MKIMIAGAGKVGSNLARKLSGEGHQVIVIDRQAAKLEETIEKYDVFAVNGNCASLKVLRDAGAPGADLLIAATNADEVNLLCCLGAHSLNPHLSTIARIRDPEYAGQAYALRGQLALSLVVNPERQAAGEIERLLRIPGFLRQDSFAGGRVEIVELGVEPASQLADKALKDLGSLISGQTLICTVIRQGRAFMPDGSFILRPGDRIFVAAPTSALEGLLKELGIIPRKVSRVMIIGGSRIGAYLAESLIADHVQVKIIEQDPAKCRRLAQQLPKAQIIEGDGSDQAFLESEGAAGQDAFVALTGLDETNLVLSLCANSLKIPQIITKISRLDDRRFLDQLPVGSIITPKELCCDTIVAYVRAMQGQTGAAVAVHAIAADLAEAMEFVADEGTRGCGRPLREIRTRSDVLIACILHRGEPVIPNGDSMYQPGDSLVIVTGADSRISRLNEIFA